MTTAPTPVINHARQAEDIADRRADPPAMSDQIALAQVHATLAVAQAFDRLTAAAHDDLEREDTPTLDDTIRAIDRILDRTDDIMATGDYDRQGLLERTIDDIRAVTR